MVRDLLLYSKNTNENNPSLAALANWICGKALDIANMMHHIYHMEYLSVVFN